jgi:UDP-N-acetylmuramate dehydrogenase
MRWLILEHEPDAPAGLLANWAARRGLKGMEFCVAIPGSVGGAVRMNAGAHGSDVSQRLVCARVFDVENATAQDRSASALELSYRKSNLTDGLVVLDALFELAPGERGEIRERMEAYRRHRAETQPGAAQNAGSVFKNPPGDSAGRLVDAAGLKGFGVGGVSVSTLHANFFVASPGARAQDVFDLVCAVRLRVADRFGVALEPEIRFAGAFRAGAVTASQGAGL